MLLRFVFASTILDGRAGLEGVVFALVVEKTAAEIFNAPCKS